MQEEENLSGNPKLSVALKQTSKGLWYLGYLKADGDTIEEVENLIDSAVARLRPKIEELNSKEINVVKIQPTPERPLDPKEEQLFSMLRKARINLAEKENQPPFVICHDSVLKELARQKPTTKESMLQISGVGEKSFEKYGEIFLKAIADFLSAR